MRVRRREPLDKRLLAASTISDSGCWLWTLSVNTRGYGKMSVVGRDMLAHRVSYEVFVGEIPTGSLILHECDTPACINPDHLRIGSHKENMHDMKIKDRQAKGEKNGASKLTEEDVREIRNLLIYTNLTQSEIGEMFGVNFSQISMIKLGKSWKHVK